MASKVEFKLLGEGLPQDAAASSFVSREALSSLYEVEVRFSTTDDAFDPASLLRSSLTLSVIDTDRGRERTFTGVCNRCDLADHDGTRFFFRVVLAPPIAALAHREDSRIYQDKSVVDVVKELLAAAGVDSAPGSAVEYRLRQRYSPREYIVQYRERELDFFHRLLEDEGIFYFFEHAGGAVTMVLADDVTAVSEELTVPVVLTLSQGFEGTDPVERLQYTRRLRTSDVHLRDFDFEKPQNHPESKQPAGVDNVTPYYEYPAGFTAAEDGKRRVAARMRALRRDADTVTGHSGVSTLEAGKLLTVTGAAQEPLNGRFVVTRLVSRGEQTLSAAGGGAGNQLTNEFSGIPEGAQWAPPRITKKPRVRGVLTAVVTGPSMGDEEIHVDRYGRVKVRFHWDRVGQFDDRSSCWIRVLQVPMSGIILPRVGWELTVTFLDGDPDRPVATGRVYNAERTPPYALPGAKTSGAIKSMSSPGGAGVNEVNLGDSGGDQGFTVNAQKDFNTTIEHDQNETVAVNETTVIKVNATTSVGANQTVSVAGKQQVNVGSQHSTKVTGNISVSVNGNAVDNATANYVEKVEGDRSNDVGGNMMLICNTIKSSVTGDISRDVGAVQLLTSIASITSNVAGDVKESIGVAKVDLCKATWSETISGNKMAQIAVGELDVVKGSYESSSEAAMTTLVGGLRYAKVAGTYTVKSPIITLIGATGTLKGAGSELKLGGAPIVVKGSKIAIDTALVVKMGTSLKLGG